MARGSWCMLHPSWQQVSPLSRVTTLKVVFLIRCRGQWPRYQTEIHFHQSSAVHRDLAAWIIQRYSGSCWNREEFTQGCISINSRCHTQSRNNIGLSLNGGNFENCTNSLEESSAAGVGAERSGPRGTGNDCENLQSTSSKPFCALRSPFQNPAHPFRTRSSNSLTRSDP